MGAEIQLQPSVLLFEQPFCTGGVFTSRKATNCSLPPGFLYMNAENIKELKIHYHSLVPSCQIHPEGRCSKSSVHPVCMNRFPASVNSLEHVMTFIRMSFIWPSMRAKCKGSDSVRNIFKRVRYSPRFLLLSNTFCFLGLSKFNVKQVFLVQYVAVTKRFLFF